VRTSVAQRSPGLLPAWDAAGVDLHLASKIQGDKDLRSFLKQRGDSARPTFTDALMKLCTILQNPEAAQPEKISLHYRVVLYQRLKAILEHCGDLRRRAEKKGGTTVQYVPIGEPWSAVTLGLGGAWPGAAVRADSREFYRIALQEVLWPGSSVPDETL